MEAKRNLHAGTQALARRVDTIAEGAEFDEERTTKVKDGSGEKWIDRTAQSKRTNTLRERDTECRVLEVNPRDQLREAWSRNQSTTWSTKTSSMTVAGSATTWKRDVGASAGVRVRVQRV